MNKILFVEDDELFRESTKEFLEEEGFCVSCARNYDEALTLSYQQTFDLYILDIALGEKNGIELLREFRLFGDTKPIIMLTSYTASTKAAECFKAGCDDFIRKPCGADELYERIRAKLPLNVIELHGFLFDHPRQTLLKNGQEVDLSLKERELLSLLVARKNQTVTHETIETLLWPSAQNTRYSSIRVHINALKKIIGKEHIINVKGVGYRLEI